MTTRTDRYDHSDFVNVSQSSIDGLETSLRDQLRRDPNLLLARVMLCEVYFQSGKRNAFMMEAQKLHQRIADPETSFEWQRCAALGRKLDPESELFQSGSADRLEAAAAARAAALKMSRFGDRAKDVACFRDLAEAYEKFQKDGRFLATLDVELLHTAGRPSSLLHLKNLSRHIGGAQIYLKREDLSPPATHMIMMVTGQTLLAKELGCDTVVTSSVCGGRGLIAAAIAARFGLKCVIYMDLADSRRNMRNVFRMSLMEADLRTVEASKVRNQDVREAALDHWIADQKRCMMVTGLDAVPPPYPAMHREFAAAIGRECKRQMQAVSRRAPDVVVARGRNSADALGLFPAFLGDAETRLVCVDPERQKPVQVDEDDIELSALARDGRRLAPEIVEGVDYPNVEREHAWLRSTGRVEYVELPESDALHAVSDLAKHEGLIPSIATAHPLAWACKEARERPQNQSIVVMYAQGHEKSVAEFDRVFGIKNVLVS